MHKAIRHIFLFCCLAISAYPLIWMTLSAFRKDADVLEAPFSLPEHWLTKNFQTVLANGGFRDAAANAWLLLAAFVIAAVAFLWLVDAVQFKFRLWHLLFFVACAAAPAVVNAVPTLSKALSRPGFANAYLTSVCLCIGGVACAVLLAALAAFAFAQFRFPGRQALFLLFLLGMMIPIHVTMIPLNLLLGPQYLSLKGTPWALAGPYIAFALPISVLILKRAFEAVPKDLVEAAHMDGCNAWDIFRFVALPLAKPALATVVIFNFLTMWNEYAFALTLCDTRKPTIPIALNAFKGEMGSVDIPVICAALVVSVAPLLLVYVFAQKHIINGLTAGAVKE